MQLSSGWDTFLAGVPGDTPQPEEEPGVVRVRTLLPVVHLGGYRKDPRRV